MSLKYNILCFANCIFKINGKDNRTVVKLNNNLIK